MNDMTEIEQEFEKNVAELWKRDREQVKALEVERDEAQAAAAVMRQRLEELLEVHSEIDDETEHQTKATQAALATTAGTAFLARMAEAEWLVEHADACDFVEFGEQEAWLKRQRTFLKGEGVKACHLEDCSIYSTAKICDCPHSKSTISKQDVDQAMRDATQP